MLYIHIAHGHEHLHEDGVKCIPLSPGGLVQRLSLMVSGESAVQVVLGARGEQAVQVVLECCGEPAVQVVDELPWRLEVCPVSANFITKCPTDLGIG